MSFSLSHPRSPSLRGPGWLGARRQGSGLGALARGVHRQAAQARTQLRATHDERRDRAHR